MAGDARARMVDSAVLLLARRGLQATSFSEVLERSGAPRGSIYHHFPAGKDQLVGAALDLAAARLDEVLDRLAGAPAAEVARTFLDVWRGVLTRSGFEAGCAVVAVTVATDSAELLDRTAAVFRGWRGRLAERLAAGGLGRAEADRFAATLLAAAEGAVLLARAERSIEPFDLIRDQLLAQLGPPAP